jgi:N-acetylmuramoyl-L-alanine amidase
MRLPLIAIACFLVSGVSAQVTGLNGWSLFVDPGHSATENQGAFGYSEAEKNLRVALALRDLLEAQTDIDAVHLSRTSDLQIVSLSQRSDMANSLGVDWFHSIHSDASSSTSANSTLLLWGQLLNGSEKSPPGGSRMSDFMVDNLTRGMRTTTRGSRGDCGFYRSFIPDACSSGGPYLSVNRRTTMPSELSESGFHTNPTQNQRNMSEGWKRLEAQTLFWSILDFWGIARPPARILTGFVTDAESGKAINGATVAASGKSYTTDTYETLFRFYSSDPEALRNGFYYLDDAAPGPQPVTVSADGYDTEEFVVVPTDTFFTFFDIQLVNSDPPRVVSTTPLEGETAFRVVDPIVITFSRRMDRTSVENAFSVDPSVEGRFSWTNGDLRLSFLADSLSSLTDVTVRLAASAQDAFGHPIDGDGDGLAGGDFELTFTTGSSDTQAPVILDRYPRTNQSGIELDPIISIVFDEEVDPGSISANQVSLLTVTGASVSGQLTHDVVGAASVLSLFPSQTLEPSTIYLVRVLPGLRDLVGNERLTIQQYFFTTRASGIDRVSLDDFESDVDRNWQEPAQSSSTIGVVPGVTSRSTESKIVNLWTGSATSLRIDFAWDNAGPEWLIREQLVGGSPRSVAFDSTFAVQAYVFGDGSGTLFRFAVSDRVPEVSDSNLEASPWYTVDWIGWRFVSWLPGRDGVGVWHGDGVLDGTLVFDSFQLSRAPGEALSGSLVIDDLSLSKNGFPTDVEEGGDLPEVFRLLQNYPNPFSRSTTVRLSLPEPGALSVSVYNVLGEEVARLKDEPRHPAGSVELTWAAFGMPSGVYLVRARFEGLIQTVHVVLVK